MYRTSRAYNIVVGAFTQSVVYRLWSTVRGLLRVAEHVCSAPRLPKPGICLNKDYAEQPATLSIHGGQVDIYKVYVSHKSHCSKGSVVMRVIYHKVRHSE